LKYALVENSFAGDYYTTVVGTPTVKLGPEATGATPAVKTESNETANAVDEEIIEDDLPF